MRRVLVVGDLTIDLLFELAGSALHSPTSKAGDLTISYKPIVRVGGSAILFAKAILARTSLTPVIFSGVGDDVFGAHISEAVSQLGLDVDAVEIVKGYRTALAITGYSPDRSRLMLRPEGHAGKHIRGGHWKEWLAEDVARDCDLLFISGYVIASASPRQLRAVKGMASWARSHGVPVMLDLVPHEFDKGVGSLDLAAKLLGGTPDAFVAELRTARYLGLVPSKMHDQSEEEQSLAAARSLSAIGRYGLIQYQSGRGTYRQTLAIQGEGVYSHESTFDEADRTGLGDMLCVEALVEHGCIQSSKVR
ncbi:MAG: carbohydrate kinase family protein [Frankiaceae bacterium]